MGARLARLPAPRRSRWRRPAAAVVVAAVAIGGLAAWMSWRDRGASTTSTAAPSTSLPTRTIEAGAVTVEVQPRQFDANGAVFKIILDTHSADLDQDLVGQASLVVGDTTWPAVGWTGDEAGGHHREGELRFTAAGTAAGTATLSIDGFSEPVIATWDLGP